MSNPSHNEHSTTPSTRPTATPATQPGVGSAHAPTGSNPDKGASHDAKGASHDAKGAPHDAKGASHDAKGASHDDDATAPREHVKPGTPEHPERHQESTTAAPRIAKP